MENQTFHCAKSKFKPGPDQGQRDREIQVAFWRPILLSLLLVGHESVLKPILFFVAEKEHALKRLSGCQKVEMIVKNKNKALKLKAPLSHIICHAVRVGHVIFADCS